MMVGERKEEGGKGRGGEGRGGERERDGSRRVDRQTC